ncbi:MAG: alpha-amylase [Bacteroidetes bacterium]|nr:alpha-amylase [Bacteroidota bacterium]
MVIRKSFLIPALLLALGTLNACTGAQPSETTEAPAKGNGTAPDWTKDAVSYEVNVRQYSPEGTLAAVEKELPRLAAMGVDILWLMPIHPIGIENRKGTMGSYYAVRDFKAVNAEFGTDEDFKRFVQKAHEQGLYVILDWVANHSAWDNDLVNTHPDWYTRDSTGAIIPPVPDWSDVADFNYDKGALRNYMVDCLKYWVEEFDIDGYRCDVAGSVPIAFWDSARAELDALKPVFMLAEAEEAAMHTKAFDMTYAWTLHHTMNHLAQGKATLDELDAHWHREDSIYEPSAYRMVFTSNHDENSWNGTEFERLGEAAKAMAVFSFTVPGMPLIYSGQEAPVQKRLDFFEKDPIAWNNYAFGDFYTKLCSLKSSQNALWNGIHGGGMRRLATSDDTRIYAFTRGDNQVLCLFNFSPEAIRASLKENAPAGSYQEYFSGESLSGAAPLSMELPAWGYRVYVRQ